MFNRFVKDARQIVTQAHTIASGLGSPMVEAEHLLLALTEATVTQGSLAEAGLDTHGLREALERENERSLAAVGISPAAFDLPPVADAGTKPQWATSAKLALERSLKVAMARKDSRIEPAHLVLGVLRAPVGTVPRALEVAGLDRLALARRVEAELDRDRS
jgi:ATP-dependent Clp protease ATP-binding subunit ClpA